MADKAREGRLMAGATTRDDGHLRLARSIWATEDDLVLGVQAQRRVRECERVECGLDQMGRIGEKVFGCRRVRMALFFSFSYRSYGGFGTGVFCGEGEGEWKIPIISSHVVRGQLWSGLEWTYSALLIEGDGGRIASEIVRELDGARRRGDMSVYIYTAAPGVSNWLERQPRLSVWSVPKGGRRGWCRRGKSGELASGRESTVPVSVLDLPVDGRHGGAS